MDARTSLKFHLKVFAFLFVDMWTFQQTNAPSQALGGRLRVSLGPLPVKTQSLDVTEPWRDQILLPKLTHH